MQTLRDWDLMLDVDQVLIGQGADPKAVHERSPHLVEIAQRALVEGQSLLEPLVIYRRLAVQGLKHERLELDGGTTLIGRLIAQHLALAEQVVVILCTIGDGLENRISEVMTTDPPYGLALDGFGSAAVEALAADACNYFGEQTAAKGMERTIPFSPGMVGWSVEEGQKQIFDIFSDHEIDIKLTSSGMMVPRKSISMVLGLGADLANTGRACDFCNMRETCCYQDHYV